VRFADEIVDTFHDYNKEELLERFKKDTYLAIDEKISLNPILHSFQATVHTCGIERVLIELFLRSMEMDLSKKEYDAETLQKYILGSAEAVGLMCLRVFCRGNTELYEQLKPYAMSLGAAFQKINFLRDLKADFIGMGRVYFPGLKIERFDDSSKKQIEASIEKDFHNGYLGIRKLPRSSRFGVYIAYVYYLALFKKIKNTPSEQVLQSRIRIRNRHKARLLAYSYVKHQLNIL
jgi:phytoene/squalene synthetase